MNVELAQELTRKVSALVRYVFERGNIENDKVKAFENGCCQALWDLLQEPVKQEPSEEQTDPQWLGQDGADCFLSLLRSALATGRGHVFDLGGGPLGIPKAAGPSTANALGWKIGKRLCLAPQGQLVGWLDDSILYLDGKASYAVACGYAIEHGASLATKKATVFNRIHGKGLLARTDKENGKNRLSIKKRIHGNSMRVYALRLNALLTNP